MNDRPCPPSATPLAAVLLVLSLAAACSGEDRSDRRAPGDAAAPAAEAAPAAGTVKLLPEHVEGVRDPELPTMPPTGVGCWASELNPIKDRRIDRYRKGHELVRSAYEIRLADSRRSVVLPLARERAWTSPVVDVPEGARLCFSTLPYLRPLGGLYLALDWSVAFVPEGGGPARELWRRQRFLAPPTGDAWRDWSVDLAALAGERGSFRFAVDPAPAGAPVPPALVAAFGAPTVVAGGDLRPNVLIVSVDTLRRDHISPYGADPARTPNLERLARRGVTVENHWSSAPWTLPSYATLFTGEYPSGHGAGKDFGADPGAAFAEQLLGIASDVPNLVEHFDRAGYHTQAFYANGHLNRRSGVQRGFEGYVWYGLVGRGATRMFDAWLDTVEERPFLCFVQMVDPHWPLEIPRGFEPTDAPPDPDDVASLSAKPFELLETGVPELDREPFARLYESLVEYMDLRVGELLDALDEHGLTERTLVVFHVDHGEELWDHGQWWHGHTQHAELVRVPLIYSWPGVLPEGARVDGQLRGPDVLPTAMDLVGLWPPPGRAPEGRSFAHLLRGEEGEEPPPALHEGELYGPGGDVALTSWPWRLILQPRFSDGGETAHEGFLFNLESDPEERVNLREAEPERYERMLARARELQEAARERKLGTSERTGGEGDDDVDLEMLGYAGDD